ncbi:SpvB/TcaC N-terminal domain-containing protein [Terrimonas alba]|uniref:SpvB/TcaC N-terminal domain-containing protein n=1 Tax=Terrimonas alba TaxID=3349636 RepID=UPI0035F31C71
MQEKKSTRQVPSAQKDEAKNHQGVFSDQVKSPSIQLQTPQISLPKGGGAIKGIDEKFQVNAVNGTASFSIPLPISKSRSNVAPAFSLSYNSGAGNSCYGLGWNIDFPSIQRKTDKQLPLYRDAEESDVFMFTGTEDLVPFLKEETPGNWQPVEFISANGEKVKRYRPRIEGSFIRIEKITPKDNSSFYWRVTTPDNTVTIFGRNAYARISNPLNPEHIFKWLPELTYDDKGSCMEFGYVKEDLLNVPGSLHEQNRFNNNAPFTNLYLKRVMYGNKNPYYPNPDFPYNPNRPGDPQYLFEVVWDFGDHHEDNPNPAPGKKIDWPCRLDPFSDYRSGFEIRTYRLCRRILFFHYFKELNDNIHPASCLVRSLNLEHRYFNNQSVVVKEKRNAETDYIISVQQFGYKKSRASYTRKGLPPVTFTYQEPPWKKNIKEGLQWDTILKNVSSENTVHAPVGLGNNYQWVDLWSEGISGILTEQAEGWFYKSNLGDGNFSEAKPVLPKPSFTGLSTGQLQLQDIEADGRKFITNLSGPVKGYFELSDDNEWQPFKPFDQVPNINLSDPNTKFIDLNGDGKADLIISEENVFTWYPNRGVAGYDSAETASKPYDEEKGAALVFSDAEQRIFLADMSGDGLTDIVRIRNSEIVYWPNLGYGRFGSKVNMSNAPVFDTADHFNPAYLHLADISGTGATDVLYLGKNQGKGWLNLSGNGWSETIIIDPFFHTELPNQISVVDFLGNGTGCIVWSSALPAHTGSPMRYIDLMGDKKPYILSAYQNNMGKEVSWDYKSSTYYYLEDKKSGKPWITKLPFPVQCLSQVHINDRVAGTYFTSKYSYHHGYYDHAEREFRGFGRVEQTDTEDFDRFKLIDAKNVVEEKLHQPPVRTVSWFHTGAFFDREKIFDQFKDEYRKELYEFDLPEPVLPKDLTVVESIEALRACKGTILRQEVYTLADPSKENLHSVAKHNCLIKLLQPTEKNRFAVFLVQESEAASFYYEKNTNDPRIAHTFNLEVNRFGQILQSAAVVYGRKKKDASLPEETRNEQDKTHVIYTLNYFTNDWDKADAYRLPLPAETKTFELTGVLSEKEKYSINDLLPGFSEAIEIKYEQQAGSSEIQKRLVENIATAYLSNDLETQLDLYYTDTLGFISRQYKMAFTPSLVNYLFGDKLTDKMLGDAKYVEFDKRKWWVSSGRTIYFNQDENKDAARQRFYLPVAIEDVFENETKIVYDGYNLLVKETQDELQNTTTAEQFDYRTLAPLKLKDLNDNISEIITDELGMEIATSIYGEESDRMHGDESLTNYSIIRPAGINEVIADPHKFLQKATTFFYYDLDAWKDRSVPVCFCSIVRETHASELEEGKKTNVFRSVGYSSGSGQLLQTKVQAEPGIAKKWVDGELKEISVDQRWVGTGRTILNNKGNPVKQYEPFFSTAYAYETEKELVEIGFSSTLYYDALCRSIKTEHSNGTFSQIEFDAWKQLSYDENDTVLESDWYKTIMQSENFIEEPKDPLKRAAWFTAKHSDTPSEAHLDSLGRVVLSITNNGSNKKYKTRSTLDIENNQLEVIDARRNTVMKFEYDMLGRILHQHSMDSRDRWLFPDAMDRQVYAWDSRDHHFHSEYDKLHRPIKQWLVEDINRIKGLTEEQIKERKIEKLIHLTIYGEGQLGDKEHNLRGKPFQSYDQSGLAQSTGYDFKGNAKSSFKQLSKKYKDVVDWNVEDPFSLLEEEPPFVSAAKHNAVNHPVEMKYHDGSTVFYVYNEANLLNKVSAHIISQGKNIPFVENIDYNAKGQRENILYGNTTLTTYTYDEKTYRLTQLRTTRKREIDPGVFKFDVLQELNYTYDPIGNIIQIIDKAQQDIFFNNAKIDPSNVFEYDAIYRLIYSKGREHVGQSLPCDQFDNHKMYNGDLRLTLKSDKNAMQYYEQLYVYDEVGNIERMIHRAGIGQFENRWTRIFTCNRDNNQLISTEVNGRLTEYRYDEHGNMLNLQYNADTNDFRFDLVWNYADQLSQINLEGGGTAYYVYDSSGQRVRKVIENKGKIKDRIYLGNYELYKEQNGSEELKRMTLHIMDDKQRIALVENRVKGTDEGLPFLIRYQYSNHLGTACLELDEKADIISYEEYYPYGSTAYQATRNQTETPKRYRYTGKERDEESGLEYHGARYYAVWLGRWVSCDPEGISDGVNIYSYVNNFPIVFYDQNGRESKKYTDEDIRKMTNMQIVALLNHFFGENLPLVVDYSKRRIELHDRLVKHFKEHDLYGSEPITSVDPDPYEMDMVYSPSSGAFGKIGPRSSVKADQQQAFEESKEVAINLVNSIGGTIGARTPKVATSKGIAKNPRAVIQWNQRTYEPKLGTDKPVVPRYAGLLPVARDETPASIEFERPPKKGEVAGSVGFKREVAVTKLTGGKLARNPNYPYDDLRIEYIHDGKTSCVPIDVLGPNGEFIIVGGPAKETNISHLTQRLRQLKMAANYRGVQGIAYFSSDTSEEVINKAKDILGEHNVRTFELK